MEPDDEQDDSFRSVDRNSDRTRRGSEENGLHVDAGDEQEDSTGSVAAGDRTKRLRLSQRRGAGGKGQDAGGQKGGDDKTQLGLLRAKLLDVIESPPVSAVMTVFTIYSLYEDDIRLLAATKEEDAAFLGVITFCFFLFLLELCLLSWLKPRYFCVPRCKEAYMYLEHNGWLLKNVPHVIKLVYIGSFYFWLDVIATFSLLLQVSIKVGGSVVVCILICLLCALAGMDDSE